MAEIQAALSAKFMQVASSNKFGHKDVAAASKELASFFSVLKSQLTKPDAPDDGLVLELKAESVKKLFLVQSDTDSTLPVAPDVVPSVLPLPSDSALAATAVSAAVISSGSTEKAPLALASLGDVSSQPPLPNDSALAAAAISTTVIPSGSPAKDSVALVQDVESASSLSMPSGEAGAKSAGASRSESLLKANAAAIAADAGQTLPLVTPSLQADASLIQLDVMVEEQLESGGAPALPALVGARADVGAASSMTPVHPFEQVFRQAESKLNAAIEAPLRSATFAAELADKVVWLSGRQGQFADLSLNPPQMGALEVRLIVSGGDASAQFFSPNPVVRDAIDAALPKLRELMAQAGLSLGEAEVRDHAFSRRESAEMQNKLSAQDVDTVANQAALAGIGMIRSGGLGLVDLYI